MANFDSALYTAQAAAINDQSSAPNLRSYGGNLHVLHAEVTLTNATADDDVLRLGYLPLGAKLFPHLSKVQCHADPGTTLLLDIGTVADPDAFADGITLSSGGAVFFDSGSTVTEQAKTPAKTTAETLVQATIPTSGASTITNGSKLTFFLVYAQA